jgi:hypothetical protein
MNERPANVYVRVDRALGDSLQEVEVAILATRLSTNLGERRENNQLLDGEA